MAEAELQGMKHIPTLFILETRKNTFYSDSYVSLLPVVYMHFCLTDTESMGYIGWLRG